MKLAEKIVSLRKQHNMSQEELAEKLKVSRQAVSRWEVGSAQPDASNILQLSRLFGVSADYLLNDEYESDGDIPAVKSVETAADQKIRKIIQKIFAFCVSAVGLLGNFIIYLLSRFIKVRVPFVTYPNGGAKTYTWSWDKTDYSYKYFIQAHNLEFLTTVFWILFVGGIFFAFANREKIRDTVSRWKKRKKTDNREA